MRVVDLAEIVADGLPEAANVEAYLKQELAAFGVSHYSIFTTGNGTASTVTSSATAANVARNGHVIASIS